MKKLLSVIFIFNTCLLFQQAKINYYKSSFTNFGVSATKLNTISAKTFTFNYSVYKPMPDSINNNLIISIRQKDASGKLYTNRGYHLKLNENDSISGAVFAFQKEPNPMKRVGVLISKESFVHGQVYSNGYADIEGTIFGSVMCASIILSTPSSVYENHLLNAVIDQTKRLPYFVGITITEESASKKIVKWLN